MPELRWEARGEPASSPYACASWQELPQSLLPAAAGRPAHLGVLHLCHPLHVLRVICRAKSSPRHGWRQSTHLQSRWASGDAADGTTAGFCSRNSQGICPEGKPCPIYTEEPDHRPTKEKTTPGVLPLRTQICPGSSSQPISFCRSAEMKITTENKK